MTDRKQVRVEGEHYTHLLLWRTAQHLFTRGEERAAGCYYPYLAATVFSFFAFESYLNELGRQFAADVWNDERQFFAGAEYRGTLGKFNYLAEKAGVECDKGRRPYQTVRQLAGVRDQLVHARTEAVDAKLPTDDLNAARIPPATAEVYGTRAFAGRALEDVEALANELMSGVFKLYGDIGVGYQGKAFAGVDGQYQAWVE